MQAGDDSLDHAEDGVVCGRIQQSFGTQPQVWGHNVYYFWWAATNFRTTSLILVIWLW
jgi:hypothetical protein